MSTPAMSVVADQPTILSYRLPKRPTGRGKNAHSRVVVRIDTSSFPCVDSIDGFTLLDFADALMEFRDVDAEEGSEEEDGGKGLQAARALFGIFEIAIIDYPAFKDFVKKNGVPLELLAEIAQDLMGTYTNRPSEQPSES